MMFHHHRRAWLGPISYLPVVIAGIGLIITIVLVVSSLSGS